MDYFMGQLKMRFEAANKSSGAGNSDSRGQIAPIEKSSTL